MTTTPNYWTTHVGSVPYTRYDGLYEKIATTLDIPAWPQLVRRTFRENMYAQYSDGLPSLILDDTKEKVMFDTSGDLTSALERFYERYLADDLDSFALTPEYAEGFFAMLATLRHFPGEWIKGQITGPISFGLTVTDQDLRASLYHDQLADVIVKNAAMKARWQIRQLRQARPQVILFVDEPYMASFGSAFISLSREQVISMLDEVFAAIHQEEALAGVHCCANTDWGVLLGTTVDILNIDAYEYVENLALYPAELRTFLDRGGWIAWGIVPNNEAIKDTTPEQLAQRLRAGMKLISDKAQVRGGNISVTELAARSIILPSCGLGSATAEIADLALRAVADTAALLRQS